MESLLKDVEPRLQKVLLQLKNETTIFERLMYKNANQHRRALYFRRLCQVRRDLRLLQSARLPDLIQSTTQCFKSTSKEPSFQKDKWQSKNTSSEAQNLRKCLYGVAKLMEQLSEPILQASSHIASLLGQTFFMPFSLTTYSILARLRVLVLQCLHDVVETFNVFSTWALEKGLFHNNAHDLPGSLECKWDGIKFSLVAPFTHHQCNVCVENEEFVEDCNGRRYSVLGSLMSGDTASDVKGTDEMIPLADLISIAKDDSESVSHLMTPFIEKTDVGNSVQRPADGLIREMNGTKKEKRHLITCTDSIIHVPKKKVAYVSVHSTFASRTEKRKEEMHPSKKAKKDSLFDMLLGLGDGTHKNVF